MVVAPMVLASFEGFQQVVSEQVVSQQMEHWLGSYVVLVVCLLNSLQSFQLPSGEWPLELVGLPPLTIFSACSA